MHRKVNYTSHTTIFMQSVAPMGEQLKAKNVQLPIYYWPTIGNHFIVIALFSPMHLFPSLSAKHLMSLQCIDNFGAHGIIPVQVEAAVGQNLSTVTILFSYRDTVYRCQCYCTNAVGVARKSCSRLPQYTRPALRKG
jgi:hypothetical protein